MNTDELKGLIKKITENPHENIGDLDVEQISELRKYLNPLGTVTANKSSCCVMSVFNMNESYTKKFLTTALIAFMYRLCEEYEPEYELDVATRAFSSKSNTLTADEQKERLEKITTTSRRIVKQFLNRNLKYDADKHIRSAHKLTEMKTDVAQVKAGEEFSAKIANNSDSVYKFLRTNVMSAQTELSLALQTLTTINTTLLDNTLSLDDKQALLIRAQNKLTKINAEFMKISAPLSHADTVGALEMDPPADLYYHFDRYVQNHYEQLRDVCDAVYTDRPDIDNIIINYDSFESVDDAKEFVAQHDGEFKQEPLIIENNGITLLGPFKENKAKINYYNKNTQILKDMTEQVESDQKLGKDIIEKRVKDKKKRNIEENGADAEGLTSYRETMSNIERLGGKKGLTQKEQEEYEELIRAKEDYEVPDGAIQTDVFYTDDEGKMSKRKIYTQSETPLHLQKGSQFAGKYQAKKNL
jgi:hypothetical protein